MTAANRSAVLAKLQKVLKQHYKAALPPSNRSVIEHVLFACCLENATPSVADDAFARLQEGYFDWNEVRVTTVVELAETMVGVADAADAAKRLKQALQSVFQMHYSFDLEAMRKQNLGKSLADLDKVPGLTPFAKSYVTQHAFDGHSIPINHGAMAALQVIGLVSDADAAKGVVPGLERAVPKNKGAEFGSWLHQFGVEYQHNPFGARIRGVILEVAPDAKDRLPKRSITKAASSAGSSAAGAVASSERSVRARDAKDAKGTKDVKEAKEAKESKAAKSAEAEAARKAAVKKESPPAGKAAPAQSRGTSGAEPAAKAGKPKEKPETKPVPKAAKRLVRKKPR